MECRHFRISGRVQGVGYRAWFEREAVRLNVSGWVRNRLDGTVEALVCGAPETLEAIEHAARRGPAAAWVAGFEATPAQETCVGFTCRPTV